MPKLLATVKKAEPSPKILTLPDARSTLMFSEELSTVNEEEGLLEISVTFTLKLAATLFPFKRTPILRSIP